MTSLIGRSAWEFLQSNPEQQANFNAAMRDLSASMTPAVTASYDWSKFPVIADIGGGISCPGRSLGGRQACSTSWSEGTPAWR